jgi:isocitrate dehydrogenase kinase/phosphatase
VTATPFLETDVSRAADIVTRGFEWYRERTARISRRARRRFECRDWPGLHQDALQRLDVFPAAVAGALQELDDALGDLRRRRELWCGIRDAVRRHLETRVDGDLGATFFNSVVRRALGTIGADPHTEFVGDLATPPVTSRLAVRYRTAGDLFAAVRRLLADRAWASPWQNLPADAEVVAGRIVDAWGGDGSVPDILELLPHVFYRGTRAFIVGHLLGPARRLPLTLALRNGDGGVAVDAVLLSEDAVSIVFSFTRSYFHVEEAQPAAMVAFLSEIMPRKPRNELYTALGFFKHGKSLLYRDVARHIGTSDDRFVHAPGARGMVMATFVMPGIDVVFKVIRDEFAPPKTTTRKDVMDRYAMVFKHDRAGRLVDAQEFEHLAFPRDRFAPALLDELRASCGSQLHEYGDTIEIRHLYTERRLVPLDLFLAQSDRATAEDAILDWGQAIKDLAATNIFPGDLLLKNFGVTRHGRVVFYDYDELCPLDWCRFRRLPPPPADEDALAAEPWFHVADGDVFPEEFMTFLGLPAPLKPVFLAAHGDLFDVRFWQAMQARHAAGEVVDILPYRESQRLRTGR